MNNKKFKEELLNRTNYDSREVDIIDNIIEKHFIIGKNNKKKMLNDFTEQLNINEKEADELYNMCMNIIMSSLKNKIKHPFKNNKD